MNENVPADVVALRGGYKRFRLLAFHTRRIVGASPLTLDTTLTEREFVNRLERFALRG